MGFVFPKKNEQTKKHSVRVDENMPDYSKDPTFIKRAEEAAAFLKKHPLPPDFKKRVLGIGL
jgi:hypothetical protein